MTSGATHEVEVNFYLVEKGGDSIDRLSLSDKWYVVPLLCGKSTPSSETFDPSKQPFQNFSELIRIRNWLVHLKVGRFVDARKDLDSGLYGIG